MNGEILIRGVDRGRGAAGHFADAAGEHGELRSAGFASQSLTRGYQGSLAEARHPFAMMRSPFGTGVKWSGMADDGGGIFNRCIERGRCVAGHFADAAGEHGEWRSTGFACRIGKARPREALAKARHPWAILRSPFRAGVMRSGGAKDGGSCVGGDNVKPVTLGEFFMGMEGMRTGGHHGFLERESFMDDRFSTRHEESTPVLSTVSHRRCGQAERMRLAECCGLGGPRALSAGCFTDENAMT